MNAGKIAATALLGLALVSACSSSTPVLTQTLVPTRTQTPTPPPTYTPTYIPVTPVLAGTPAMDSAGVISIDTLKRLTLFARWGDGNVREAKYTPDGKYMVAASSIGLYFYNTQDYSIAKFIDTNTALSHLAISPDGKTIAATTFDEVLLFNSEEKSLVASFAIDANSLSFSPDGKILATGRYADPEGFVELWNVADGTLIRSIESEYHVQDVSFSPDGNFIVAGGTWMKIWTVEGELLSEYFPPASGGGTYDPSFTPDGKLLALATAPSEITIWRMSEKGATVIYKYLSLNDYSTSSSISISPDGEMIAAGTKEGVYIWRVHSGGLVKKFESDYTHFSDVAWSPDSQSLISVSIERGIEVWEIESEKLTFAPSQITGNFNSLAWAPADNTIAASTEEGYIYLLQAPSGNVTRILDHGYIVDSLNFSPDGQYLAAGNLDHLVQIWNLDGTVLKTFKGFGYGSTSVSFSTDGSLFAAGINDGEDYSLETIRFWNVRDWTINSIYTFADPYNIMLINFKLSPNNQFLAVALTDMSGEYHEDFIRIVDFNTSELLTTLDPEGSKYRIFLQGISFSPDGRFLIAHSYDLEEDFVSVERIRIWRVSAWELLYTVDIPSERSKGHRGWELNNVIAWSPESAFFALGVPDGSIQIREAETGELLHSFSAHTLVTTGVAFSPDGRYLISVSLDGTFKLWGLK